MIEKYTLEDIQYQFEEISRFPYLIEKLDYRLKSKVYDYAIDQQVKAIKGFEIFLNDKNTFERLSKNSPEYTKAQFVIDLLTAQQKVEIKSKNTIPLTLKCNLSYGQLEELTKSLIGFLFAENTDFYLLHDFFASKDISIIKGRIDIKHSTRLFAYFFNQLYMRNLIDTKEYQNIIGLSKLFYTRKGELITSNNLSTVINHINSKSPSDYKKIDTILDQFKAKV